MLRHHGQPGDLRLRIHVMNPSVHPPSSVLKVLCNCVSNNTLNNSQTTQAKIHKAPDEDQIWTKPGLKRDLNWTKL